MTFFFFALLGVSGERVVNDISKKIIKENTPYDRKCRKRKKNTSGRFMAEKSESN
jgi:hypothetical protein